ncbi:MAG: 50S ribosomal protein L19e [DPANN group archaeon]|nr:50S ribosomal protein L19e [DPANN group archaeon]
MDSKRLKQLAGDVLNTGAHKIVIKDLEKARQALTRDDIRALAKQGALEAKPRKGVSRGRAKKIAKQKKKGLRKGRGKRKGAIGTRLPKKEVWMTKIRALRRKLQELKPDLPDIKTYRHLYNMSRGGYFRNKAHLQIFIEDKGYITKEKNKVKKQ